jgi:hypothetical protein
MKKLLLFLLFTVSTFGQVGINTSNPQAVLDINSTTSGILIPRLTTTERNAIVSPVNSMMIYNSTLNEFQYYLNTEWKSIITTYNYSLTETVVGTWIDGKPIYRKTFVGEVEETTFLNISNLNIQNIVDVNSLCYNSETLILTKDFKESIRYGNNGFNNTSTLTQIGGYLNIDGSSIELGIASQFTEYNLTDNSIISSGFYDTQYIVTLEYTKTTD